MCGTECSHVPALQYRAHPERYPDASLGNYLKGAEGLSEGEILMDMHQMVCVGSYGGVTSVVSPFIHEFRTLNIAGLGRLARCSACTAHCGHARIHAAAALGTTMHVHSMQ